MKKLTAILAICMVAIPMMAVNATAPEQFTQPYEWVEYGEYELSGKDTAKLILTVIYEDMSFDYKGWYAEFNEEWQRTEILNDISIAIEIIDKEPINWQMQTGQIIMNIQDNMHDWMLNLDGKDYTNWLDYALIYIEIPDEIINSIVQPFNNCCSFTGWSNCYEWLL